MRFSFRNNNTEDNNKDKMKKKNGPAFLLLAVVCFCSLQGTSGRYLDESSERGGMYIKLYALYCEFYTAVKRVIIR